MPWNTYGEVVLIQDETVGGSFFASDAEAYAVAVKGEDVSASLMRRCVHVDEDQPSNRRLRIDFDGAQRVVYDGAQAPAEPPQLARRRLLHLPVVRRRPAV